MGLSAESVKFLLVMIIFIAAALSVTGISAQERMKMDDGYTVSVVIEAAGNPITYRAAVDEVAFSGRVVCIGYAATEVSFATKLFVQKEIEIRGSRNASAEDFRAVISYLERGTFPLEKMVTMKVKPEGAVEALATWADEPGKVMKIVLDLR